MTPLQIHNLMFETIDNIGKGWETALVWVKRNSDTEVTACYLSKDGKYKTIDLDFDGSIWIEPAK